MQGFTGTTGPDLEGYKGIDGLALDRMLHRDHSRLSACRVAHQCTLHLSEGMQGTKNNLDAASIQREKEWLHILHKNRT